MMIRAEELRKGNLFLCQLEVDKGEEVCKVEWITKNGIENQTGGICPYSASNPVLLTPEWLERCGLFENGASYKGELRFKGCGHLTIEVIENGSLGYFAPFNRTIEIKYLHQLQNLYYLLTGEELNVKL